MMFFHKQKQLYLLGIPVKRKEEKEKCIPNFKVCTIDEY